MQQTSAYMTLPGLLNEERLAQVHQLIQQSVFEDGKTTASAAAREVKNNWQMSANAPQYMQVQQVILSALNGHPQFRQAVQPRQVHPFLVSRYQPGMSYGWHVDSPLMGNLLRTDVAMTIFLNEPEAYEGGELELQSPSGTVLYKLNMGDAICYPCTQLHRVREVISGERLVAVSWIQSMVKDAAQRSILYDFYRVQQSLLEKDLKSEEAALLMQQHSNLLRMWADC